MLESIADLHVRTRDIVFSRAPSDLLFAFDIQDSVDAGASSAGPLFEQNEDFWLFELDIIDTGRAGPGKQSPRRCWASLSISYLTKRHGNVISGLRKLEEVAAWFRNQNISDVRFRDFLPVSPARIQGFTAHSGVINCDFELTP